MQSAKRSGWHPYKLGYDVFEDLMLKKSFQQSLHPPCPPTEVTQLQRQQCIAPLLSEVWLTEISFPGKKCGPLTIEFHHCAK